MEGRLKVEMLGQFLLSRGGEELAGLQAPRMRALLSRLLLDAGRNVDRAELAFTLWPDSTEALPDSTCEMPPRPGPAAACASCSIP